MNESARTTAFLAQLAAGQPQQVDLVKILGPGRVCIRIAAASTHPQGQLLLSFAVNLLARLYPIVQHLSVSIGEEWDSVNLVPAVPRWRGRTLREHIHRMLSAVAPSQLRWDTFGDGSISAQETLCVGEMADSVPGATHVGSDGWMVFASTEAASVTGAPNAVGAYAAACIGVGEVCKRLFYRSKDIFQAVPIVPLTVPLAFSTFTYLPRHEAENPPLPGSIDLGRFTMIGLGAGGGASAYTLASLHALQGYCNLIDPDRIEDTNLNRYVFADRADAAAAEPKVSVVEALFKGFPQFRTVALAAAFQKAASGLDVEDFRYVQAAVHSREARREIQRETPKVLWDGAAEEGEFRVWRHILGDTECMFCKHPPGQEDPEEQKAQQLSKLLGVDAALCLRKLRNHDAFDAAECDQIRDQVGTAPISFDLPYPGQRFNDWETAQCGRLSLPDADDAIPFPLAPVMAGVLLAGELIKERYFPGNVLRSMYWNTLLGKFMVLNPPRVRIPREKCSFCSDTINLGQYTRRWG